MPRNRNYIYLLLTLLIVSEGFLFSQNLRFKPFGTERGLTNKYVYCINQGADGYIWLGSGDGIFRFDGFRFIRNFQGDSLPQRIVVCDFCDSKDRLWFGYRDGSVAVLEGIHFRLLPTPDDKRSSINSIVEDTDGNIVIATQDKGILIIGKDNTQKYITEGLEGQLLSSLRCTNDNVFLTGTFDGFFLFRLDIKAGKAIPLGRVEDIPYTKVQSIIPSRTADSYWIGTETDGIFLLKSSGPDMKSSSVTKIGTDLGLKYSNVLDIYEDQARNLWVCTNGEGVFRLLPEAGESGFSGVRKFDTHNGLPSNYVSDIFEDFEGNLWFSTIGEAITVLKDQSFSFYSYESEKFNDNILSVCNDGNRYYLGGETSILVTDKNGDKVDYYIDRSSGLPADKITALYKDRQNTIWIGTSHSGVYRMNAGGRSVELYHFSNNSLENIVNSITGNSGNIWIGTNGGVFAKNLIDGTQKVYTTTERLPHNKINDLFLDKRGNLWVATRYNGLYCLNTNQELRIEANTELEFVSITEDNNGDLWGATDGDGIFHFSKDSLGYFSTRNGLLSNYCYSISTDRNGDIWVGHSSGLSRIDVATGKIRKYSSDQGITANCNYNSSTINPANNLVIGTSKGLIEFDPSKEQKQTSPPKLNISGLKISDVDYDFSHDIKLSYGKYKIRIDFIGINMKNPEGVSYQYKLDGYDEWSEPTSNPYVIYSRIEDGKYTFLLKACSDSNNCSPEPLKLGITVKIPVWKAWWFILLVIFTTIGSVYFYIKYREKKQKEIQEYLENELELRTKEVVLQAEEIENKNRDITDSINYAQRIQASILPPLKRLQDTFTDSFVFYQPRDIVSGDFYWYDRVWGDKFVIVCADSTGHGVPGAFMSMIGTTLIKDICSRTTVTSPSEILKTLDIEIQSALNQNLEAEKSNDGMDIIVAEIDLKTRYIRVASAMRPMIIYINGEQIYVKGSRSSVGGHFEQEKDGKTFQDEGFQLSKGDIVYMFSDGYSDQFGGPLGKKFKMVRLRNLLHDIHDKPMHEQYNYVKSNFNLWKEDMEQVDDVLFMGLKI
jgi:ligand-binding sensor domain-containing protein/serine phosphatase RsbU (regulator of sigma subunit)